MTMSTKDIFIDSLEERIRELKVAARDLCVAVERYTRQEILRSELMIKKDNLKNLLK